MWPADLLSLSLGVIVVAAGHVAFSRTGSVATRPQTRAELTKLMPGVSAEWARQDQAMASVPHERYQSGRDRDCGAYRDPAEEPRHRRARYVHTAV